jgi:hypothetical protein
LQVAKCPRSRPKRLSVTAIIPTVGITGVSHRQTTPAKTSTASPGRRHMRVKLCARCPYTPRDLADHYDPEAAFHVCARCDGEQGMTTNHYPRQTYRRRKCATVPNIFGTTQRSAAPSVTESLVLSGTTRGELPSVQRNALIASRPARRAIADGCADFEPPDQSCSENHAEITRCSEFRDKEAAQ